MGEPTPGLRDDVRMAVFDVLIYDDVHPASGGLRTRLDALDVAYKAALAASPAPEPTPGLREARDKIAAMTHSGTVWTGDPMLNRTDVLAILDAALAASPAPEPTGLAVERLAMAMDAVWSRGSDAGLNFVAHEVQPEYARRVAAEYARLTGEADPLHPETTETGS